MWKKTSEIKVRPEKSWFLESELLTITPEAFFAFCSNATTVSSFEQTSADRFFILNVCFLWVIFWISADAFLESQMALFLVFTWIRWTFVSIIVLSFINITTDQKKQRLPFATTVSITFSQHLISINEIFWECKMETSRKPLFGLSLLITVGKNNAASWIFFQISVFCFKSWLITFSISLFIFLLFCCECFVVKPMRSCRKTEGFDKSWTRFG